MYQLPGWTSHPSSYLSYKKRVVDTDDRRDKRKTKGRLEEPVIQTSQLSEFKLADNYLAVVEATVVLAEKREIEMPGIYQYIVDGMLKANNIPNVMFPASVVGGYKDVNVEEKNKAKRKRESAGADLIGEGGVKG